MMKLFAVSPKGSKEKPAAPFFSSKATAKNARDILNQQTDKEHIVVPGPDHHRYTGGK